MGRDRRFPLHRTPLPCSLWTGKRSRKNRREFCRHHPCVQLLPKRVWPCRRRCRGSPRWVLGLAEGSTCTLPRLLWVFQPAELSLSIRLSALSCSAASPAPSAGQGVRTRGITAWQEMLKQRLEKGISSWRPLLGHRHS